MKCSGRVALLPSGQHLGEVALGSEACSRVADFLLHPVFLDCATIVPLLPLRDRLEQTSLFIPFAIEEFQAVALTGQRDVRVLVEPIDADPGDVGDRESHRYSFGIFDRQGRQLAAVRHFTVKKVRSLQNIRGLLQKSLTVPPVRVPALAPASPAPTATDDPIRDLIGEIVAHQGGFVWNPDDERKPFFDLGLASLALLDAAEALEKRLGVRLYPTVLFENPDAAALARYLRATFPDACARVRAARHEGCHRGAGASLGRAPRVVRPIRRAAFGWREVALKGVDARRSWCRAGSPLVPISHRRRPAPSRSSEREGTRGLRDRLQAEWRGRVGFVGDVAGFGAALDEGLSCDEVCLVAVDHDFTFAVIKALIQSDRLRAPLTVKAITLDCFRVHEEAPRSAAAHGVWGLSAVAVP